MEVKNLEEKNSYKRKLTNGERSVCDDKEEATRH